MREGQAKVLSDREFNRVINLIRQKPHAKRNVALLYFSFGLGLRAKEMAAMKLKHVLDEDGYILDEINLTGSMTKGNKQRHVYLTNPKVVTSICDFVEERKEKDGMLFNRESPLFKSQKGSSFSPNTLQQLFHRMFKDAKLQGASSHSGRRTFATTLIEKGIDIKAVSTLMGHSGVSMTAQYVFNNPIRLKKICTDLL